MAVQVMGPSRTAPGGPAATSWGAMRRRTVPIADPQQRHCNLGRSLIALPTQVGETFGGIDLWVNDASATSQAVGGIGGSDCRSTFY